MQSILRESLLPSEGMKEHELDVQVLLQRASFLDTFDRQVMEAVLDRNMPATQIAQLVSIPPQRLRYRIRLLSKHLTSRRFVSAMRALAYLDGITAEVLRRNALQRHSFRRIARELNVTIHTVRTQLTLAEGFLMERSTRRRKSVGV